MLHGRKIPSHLTGVLKLDAPCILLGPFDRLPTTQLQITAALSWACKTQRCFLLTGTLKDNLVSKTMFDEGRLTGRADAETYDRRGHVPPTLRKPVARLNLMIDDSLTEQGIR